MNPPLLEVNVTCPLPVGGGMESVGAAYVMDIEDMATSPAESVALTSMVWDPGDRTLVVKDQFTFGPGVIPDTADTAPESTFQDILDTETMSDAVPSTGTVAVFAMALLPGDVIDMAGGILF